MKGQINMVKMVTKPQNPHLSILVNALKIICMNFLLSYLENSSSEQNEADFPEDEPASESTLLAKSTSHNAINPGNFHELMPTPGKSKATCSKKKSF